MATLGQQPETEPETVEQPSGLAQELASAGFHPVSVDEKALLKQLEALQARVAAMEAEKGIPSDPLGAALVNLWNHVKARADMHPGRADEFSELVDLLKEARDAKSPLDADDTALIKEVVADMPTVEGKEYVQQLAHDLHKEVLKANKAGKEVSAVNG